MPKSVLLWESWRVVEILIYSLIDKMNYFTLPIFIEICSSSLICKSGSFIQIRMNNNKYIISFIYTAFFQRKTKNEIMICSVTGIMFNSKL